VPAGGEEAEGNRERHHLGAKVQSWVAEVEGVVVGMYKLIPNRRDLGSHVANASFMVAPSAPGRGLGRAMSEHCLNDSTLGHVDSYVMQRFL
jgi:L-amino acid N-acyltransferase YncA